MYIQVNFSVENKRQLKILGSCPMTVIYMVTATYRAAIYRSTLQKYKTTENFEKLSGDHNIQSDHYIQVNFAENKSQLKILGNCPVTLICGVTATYRAAIITGLTVLYYRALLLLILFFVVSIFVC